LKKTQDPPRDGDPDILFLDRGIFDSICWLSLLQKLNRIRDRDRINTANFLLTNDWAGRITGVIAMSASPDDALKRERGALNFEGSGGSIMNTTVLKQMGAVLLEKAEEFRENVRLMYVDTSSAPFVEDKTQTCESITEKILDWVEEEVSENILSAPKKSFPALQSKYVASSAEAQALLSRFEAEGNFRPRREVEDDIERVQPLPVVVVKNRSGQILRLVRKERDPNNPLHKKITVWAGGHVHRKDGREGRGAITGGALRELQEELRIFSEPDQLKLIGAVYIPEGERTQQHLAFVYEWQAEADEVEIALCNSEFFEKPGNSLQGAFLRPEEIMGEEGLEAWSKEILSNLVLAGQAA
jgi:predicted NUDIX family phosphoesterase